MLKMASLSAMILATTSIVSTQQKGPDTAANVGRWVNISAPVTNQLNAAGIKIPWPGGSSGVRVDPRSGQVYMEISGVGLWRSDDHGNNFKRVAKDSVGGRCEFGYAMNVDPAGSRLAFFMLDGNGAMTLDGGRTWHGFANVGRNWDYGAVDWSDPQARHIFAHRHESGGEVYSSNDAGKTWNLLGKRPDITSVGVIGKQILLAGTAQGIIRSTDDGHTWTTVSNLHPIGRTTVLFRGTTYWLAQEGLIATHDGGTTWTTICPTNGAGWGPFFGANAKHFVVADTKEIRGTSDGGKTWKRLATLPPFKSFLPTMPGEFMAVGWDAKAKILYASCMSNPTYRMRLK